MSVSDVVEEGMGNSVERPIVEVYDSYVGHASEVWDLGQVEIHPYGPIGEGTRFSQVGDPRWGIRDPSAVIEVDRFELPHLLAFSGVVNVPGHLDTQSGFSSFPPQHLHHARVGLGSNLPGPLPRDSRETDQTCHPWQQPDISLDSANPHSYYSLVWLLVDRKTTQAIQTLSRSAKGIHEPQRLTPATSGDLLARYVPTWVRS